MNGILIKFWFAICFQRWQRRWFVLFDDGELTYSVDDHVSTFIGKCLYGWALFLILKNINWSLSAFHYVLTMNCAGTDELNEEKRKINHFNLFSFLSFFIFNYVCCCCPRYSHRLRFFFVLNHHQQTQKHIYKKTSWLLLLHQPETVPQASINMSDVIEVADAEQITGHCHSILIQTPDLSTFVKGTCQEESKWWYNILIQFVKSKVRHHKRNAFLKGQNQKCKYHAIILVSLKLYTLVVSLYIVGLFYLADWSVSLSDLSIFT